MNRKRKKLLQCIPLLLLSVCCYLSGCSADSAGETVSSPSESPAETADSDGVEGTDWEEMVCTGAMELSYAEEFSVDYYGEYRLITVAGEDQYLVVPEDAAVPENLPEEIVILAQPLDRIYLVATSAMDLFRALDGIGNIRLSGTDASGWYIEEAAAAIESGDMLYAGKYSAPDYELILSEDCDLAIESTMIYHTPEVKEQLEELGIPVFVERSSYESDPLGRMEWIKVYGTMLGKEAEAEEFFRTEIEALSDVLEQENTGRAVAYFYITANGAANIHKPGDYIAKMIELAGGQYAITSVETDDTATSTMNMQMEDFYLEAKDADVLIYNSTIDGELETIDDLLAKSELLADFRAVQEGNVWCTNNNMFQESTGIGTMIQEIHAILTEEDLDDSGLVYLHRLE